MKEPTEILRRRVAPHRRYLAEGVDSGLARRYIAEAEAALACFESEDRDKRR